MATFSYASRDFDTIRADMLARAGVVFPEWTDRDPSDFGMLLIDLWAHAADTLHYYIDRAADESFLSTATQRESVLALANLLDYTPQGRYSAVSTVTLQNTTSSAVLVPQYTPFTARNDSKSYHAFTANDATIPALSTAPVSVAEGTRYIEEVLTTSANGVSGQRYTLSRSDVSPSSIQCYVYEDGINRTQYQYVSAIIQAATGDRVFTTYTTADGQIQVILGTVLNGFIPPTGSKITASYVQSSGADGNLPANSIVGFQGSTPAGISIVSSTPFTGGLDDESIASLKRSIPSAVSAQHRAVTRADFISLALQVPGVAKASLSFVPGVSGGASVGTNGSVTIFPQISRSDFLTTSDTSQIVSSDMQTNVVSLIQPLALLGVTVRSATTVQWQLVDTIITVNVNSRFVQSWVKQNVSDALDELFDFDNVFFGQRLHLGQVYQIINNIDGVDYAVVTRFDLSPGTAVQTKIDIDPLKLPKKGAVVLNMVGGITTSG